MTKYYKGFNKDMTCRDFQFEEGKTYETDTAKLCRSGFHACEMPLDCFGYYAPSDSVYHEVELDGVSDERGDDTKVCAKKIKVGARLDIAGIVKASIDYIFSKTAPDSKRNIADSGNGASIGSSGDWASIGSSGYWASIGSSGYGASIGSSGNWASIGSSGYGASIGSSGDGARIGSSGNGASIGSSGDGARIGSSGYGASIGSSGDGARIGSSGYGARIGSSGNGASIGSSGDWASIGSSGDGARIGSSGNGASIGSSGYGASIEVSGNNSVAMCAGENGKIKAALGCWITLAEWKRADTQRVPVCVRSAQIDGEKLKPDTWYKLENGEFVEVKD